MKILGINALGHDTSAVLLRDGCVEAAIEEERLNRVKHTDAYPIRAINFCLKQAGLSIKDIDYLAINCSEFAVAKRIETTAYSPVVPIALEPKLHVAKLLAESGLKFDPKVIRFVGHHAAHAASAFFMSGFDEALVMSVDGIGDDEEIGRASGIMAHAKPGSMVRLKTFTPNESLGFLYGQITKLLGFHEFDEYKVMGLASYGDQSIYLETFSDCCELTPDGGYAIDRPKLIAELIDEIGASRGDAESLTTVRRNIAASCQKLLEAIIIHVLSHYRREVGARRVAMAGGVALNCVAIGRLPPRDSHRWMLTTIALP